MEYPLHQNENFKVKCKGHNFFFQIYTFLDSDFSTLIEYRNNFKFSQDLCAKSLGKLTCLKPREISIMVILLRKYPVETSFVSFFPFFGETKIIIPYSFFVCKTVGWWTLVLTSKGLRSQPRPGWPLWNIGVTNDYGYAPQVVSTFRFFPRSWLI